MKKETVIIFISNDGKEFRTEKECLEHDENLKALSLLEVLDSICADYYEYECGIPCETDSAVRKQLILAVNKWKGEQL